jgi:hypothetical protein
MRQFPVSGFQFPELEGAASSSAGSCLLGFCVYGVDQSVKDSRHFTGLLDDFRRAFLADQSEVRGNVQLGFDFMNGAPSMAKELPKLSLCKPALSFRNVGSNRYSSSPEL